MKGGHYIALRKNGKDEMMSGGSKKRSKKLAEELEAFLAQVDWEKAGIDFKAGTVRISAGECVYYMPRICRIWQGSVSYVPGFLWVNLRKSALSRATGTGNVSGIWMRMETAFRFLHT